MNDYTLPTEKVVELRATHRSTRNKRAADRIKAVLTLASGWSVEGIAEIFQIDANTVRSHFKRYRQGGLQALSHVAFRGSACALDKEQLAMLNAHTQETLCTAAKVVAHWVKEPFGVSYTESGMTALLHRLGYIYKKPKPIPGKAAQERFLAEYGKLKRGDKGESDPVYFMEAVHLQHNPVIACGFGSSAARSARSAPIPAGGAFRRYRQRRFDHCLDRAT